VLCLEEHQFPSQILASKIATCRAPSLLFFDVKNSEEKLGTSEVISTNYGLSIEIELKLPSTPLH